MSCKVNFRQAVTVGGGVLTLTSTAASSIAYLVGHPICLLKGASFGLLQGIITDVFIQIFQTKMHIWPINLKNKIMVLSAGLALGGLASFCVSYTAAAMGLTTDPISVLSALALTIANFAMLLFASLQS